MAARQCVESRERDNCSNGKMSKTVQTQYGEVTVETPRDRNGSLNLKQCESVRKCWPKAWRTRLSACTPLVRVPEKLIGLLSKQSTFHPIVSRNTKQQRRGTNMRIRLTNIRIRLGRFLYAMTDSYKIKHIHRCSRNDGCNELIYIKRIEINNSRFRFN